MKRCWIGLILLLVLLAGGILSTWYMSSSHKPMAEDARQAAAYALANDWEKANTLAEKARVDWEKRWGISAVFTNHAPMEQINSLFARLDVYGKEKNGVYFAAACAELGQALDAMGDVHGLQWWNLL